MNKKISLGAAIAYMAIVAAVAFSLTMIYSMNLFNVKMTGITEREKMYSSLHEVDLYVRENYYGSINEEALQEAIARGYIDGLEDSNARYFTAAEYEAYTQSGSGKYVGVGLVTEMDSSGYLLVREVYPDSPAQMAGIKVGALITNVNGTRVTENNNESMAGRLRGEAARAQVVERAHFAALAEDFKQRIAEPLAFLRRHGADPLAHHAVGELAEL